MRRQRNNKKEREEKRVQRLAKGPPPAPRVSNERGTNKFIVELRYKARAVTFSRQVAAATR